MAAPPDDSRDHFDVGEVEMSISPGDPWTESKTGGVDVDAI